jgi:hypothetical protein
MSDGTPYDGTYVGRRHRTGAYPVVPGRTAAGFATEDGPAPKPQPQPDDAPAWVKAVDVVKNVVVIVTCLAVLYTLWTGYRALAEIGRGLEQIQL